jgi:NitT/TauT family transport system substrate-binding protein
MSFYKRVHFATLLCLSLLLSIACASVNSPPTRPPLQFGYSSWVGYFPAAIAQYKGFFEQQGVSVDLSFSEDAQVQIADFAAGKFDGMVIVLGDMVRLNSSDPDLRLVAVIDESAGADAVVAQPEIQQVTDLKGKSIATRLGGFGEVFVTEMLKKHQMTSDDVIFVNADGDKIPERFRTSSIAAGHTWEPYVSELVEQDNGRILFTSRETPGLISDVITFYGAVVQQRPAEIRSFVKAWFQAIEYWEANPEEGNRIISQMTGFPAENISLDGVHLFTLAENQAAFAKGEDTRSLSHTINLYVDFYLKTGTLTRPPDVEKMLDTSFLQ